MFEEVEEIPPLDKPHRGRDQGLGIGVVYPLIEQGGLTEEPPRPHDLEDLGFAFSRALHEFHRPGEDQVEAEGRRPLHEDELVGPVVDLSYELVELFQILRLEVREHPEIFQFDHPPHPLGSLTDCTIPRQMFLTCPWFIIELLDRPGWRNW